MSSSSPLSRLADRNGPRRSTDFTLAPSRRVWNTFLVPLRLVTLAPTTSGDLKRLPTDSFSSSRRSVSSSGSSAMVGLPQLIGGALDQRRDGVASGGLLGLLLRTSLALAVDDAVDAGGDEEGAGVVGAGGL